MVRKQIYIYPQQDEQIKRLAQQRAISEAEVIREAIEELLVRQPPQLAHKPLPPDEAAWQALIQSMKEHSRQFSAGEPHRWRREDYYDDERTARLIA
ncbi:MAG: ribbon-helix-helix protein, CopG family [Caldilineaceae bacterium]|nr:ribbon-helix-helix protein, CopG family [Caldilineaceae bacterium]